ncbi:TetR/AcrR family transcriptional regulator [Rhabdothermincola salaria]|uniref:TetR/AcrR family transcriptional regulator n=1 Tax=Rhabdothermincola salaria TaxID=2903142 RepID=UPI0032119F2B
MATTVEPARAGGTRAERARLTDDRILAAALQSFGTKGYDATSLDQLAAELGVTKQTILYHHPSKAALLDAVIDRASADLVATFDAALAAAGPGWERVETVVRSVFRLALRRPELLGLLREVSRLGPPAATRVAANLDVLVHRARAFLESEMDAGHVRRSDPNLLLVSAYSTVIGVATEVEVLRAVGIEPTLRTTVKRRQELLAFLRSALVP